MAEGVLMPKAGITVESCIMGAWKKNVGDTVAVGDILFTYETDKAEFECESTAAGTLLATFYNEGDEVPCLVNVCAVGAAGEDFSALAPNGAAPAAPAAAPAVEVAPAAAAAPAPAPAAPTGPVAEGVIMPKAGITVESCIMGAWKKNVGDTVAVGDILYTYETDKAEFECESTAAGTLLATFYKEGDEVPCLVNVCAVGNPGDDFASLAPAGSAAAAAAPAAAAPAAEVKAAAPAAAVVSTAKADGIVRISPRAKALAEKAGVDGTQAEATGPNGRIIERDVRKLMAEGPKAAAVAEVKAAPAAEVKAAAPVAAAVAPAAEAEYEDVKFSGIRRVTAKAMHDSLSTMAQLTHSFTFDATQIQAYRKLLKAQEGPVSKITLNDIIMYAVSRTLVNHPDLNANMVGDNVIRHFKHVQLGMAVDTPRGLMVPTIHDADTKSLLEISAEAKALATEARDGAISPDKLKGGSFTVSNLGSFGVESFTPVINPPQTGILGVCTITTRIKVVDGEIKTYPAMGLCLTYDHRAVDGAPASRFMAELCKNLENFTTLLAK